MSYSRSALVLGLVVGCGGARTSEPATPPAPWRELTSEHFVVWTNTSDGRAKTLVKAMENLRQVVLGVSGFNADLRGKSFVIAFDQLDEVHQYVEPQFIAHAWSGRNVLLQPVIVLAAESLENDRRIVTHELTHVISFNAIANQPSWFSEGLAGYFETIRLDENRSTLDVGVPIENRFRQLHDEGLTSAAAMFACDKHACMDDRFYASTWALVTFLVNEHPKELAHYIELLMTTPATEQAQLWSTVFPNLPPDKLDHELATWVHYGHIKVLKYNIVLREWPVTSRPISEAEIFAAKGLLRYLESKPETTTTVPPEIARALELDASNVIANMIATVIKNGITMDTAHVITAAHPDDWRAWWLTWRAAQTPAERREAHDKTCTLLEANPAAVPIESCARDASGAYAQDPRMAVFIAAAPQISDCMKKSKPGEIGDKISIDIDITESGTVTAARVAFGSPATSACVETVVKALTFPAHHAGTFHISR